MKYTLQQIAQIINAKLIGNPDTSVSYLLTDSRAVSFPEESLFVAIKTPRNNGHKYIADLYEANVRNFLVSEKPANSKDANFLLVDDTLKAMQTLVAFHRTQFKVPVVAITGSNGKTIVKEWLYQLLQKDAVITRSPRSYNSQIGVPLSVWEMNAQTQLGIFEAGISFPGEMDKLTPVIAPTIGIFTHLGEAHQENFSSLKEKCNEKLKLFKNSEVLIYRKDDKLVDIAFSQSGIKAKPFTWGKSQEADVILQEVKKQHGSTAISYTYKGKNDEITIPFSDEASIENSLHCLALLLYLGKDIRVIAERMQQLEALAMRLQVKEGLRNCIIINDYYNSDLSSLAIALDFHQSQARTKGMKRTLILSDILQSGQKPAELYKSVSELIQHKTIDKLIAIGSEISANQELFALSEQYFFQNTEAFLQSPLLGELMNEVVLLKGSRQFKFETISEKLEAIMHQTTLEVDLSALIHNVNYFRSYLNPETKIMSMVKAYGYGSGDIEVARTLQHHNCDYLAVAVADEGADLRNEGIHIPIVVMNPEIGAFGKIFEYRLEPEIYSNRLLEAFLKEAEKQGESNYPVHIKIDTGMNRLGFLPVEVDHLIEKLNDQKQLMVRSVFTHLAGTDESDLDAFTEEQIKRYQACAEKFEKAFPYKIMRHALNSAGVERFSHYQFDMVRLGIGHYGFSAIDSKLLQEVCTLKTTILQIKTVSASETVGYNRKGKLTRDSIIGVIPIGYADGYDRKLGNGVGKVLVNGKLAPVVGNVCMDICMIDLTGISAKEGDTVVLFGQGNSINKIANSLQTIPYEVLTGISRRVKRVYYKE
ncbi:MAG: bifunctional UDP-N-acetylmuramoyl-tripeptide:D-alanyl-D-alanine ligase/alanine racemase [Paludibacteraceae bacterium]|nr:bifunctional UDP-N-acetylmuramoyl-tripeptide:D-alanyl-D-alanine ligase/alanine racemase [Paludibacteraceae bacterium]MBN2787267.1 bifunctional UDP-N-acetylmuramoyl-tripeptide:D-alanyl-D-alanine ligase/alanine racemase [Paludibacteraceae bacterium]